MSDPNKPHIYINSYSVWKCSHPMFVGDRIIPSKTSEVEPQRMYEHARNFCLFRNCNEERK